jgi:hypothetical protein
LPAVSIALPTLTFLASSFSSCQIGDYPANDIIYETLDFLPLPVTPATTKSPDILILDLDAEFAGADEVEFWIRTFPIERPYSKPSVALLFLS